MDKRTESEENAQPVADKRTESEENAQPVVDKRKDTSETNNTKDSEMETDFFKVVPTQQLFTFGTIQKDDPLALSKQEQDLLKKLDEKRNITQAELEKRIELTNRSYCTTPPESDSTTSGDTIKTTNSNMSTKRKKPTKKKHNTVRKNDFIINFFPIYKPIIFLYNCFRQSPTLFSLFEIDNFSLRALE